MSEMLPGTTDNTDRRALSRGLPPWRTLRIVIHPAYPSQLLVSLIVQPKNGHPSMHAYARGLQAAWFPEQHQDDLLTYAVSTAFLRLSQTQL
jgi:hypothetical protein